MEELTWLHAIPNAETTIHQLDVNFQMLVSLDGVQ